MLAVVAFFLARDDGAGAGRSRACMPIPADGRGLNPLLEDSGMITHPVALYLGFTGFTVPFAFAVAALVTGRVGDFWITTTRRWTIVAWYFLSLGLLIGGWWSYHVLGWGGYWAWDPGRERGLHAVAHRHRAPALGDDPGATAHAPAVEPRAGDPHLQPHAVRHLPHALRRDRLGARVHPGRRSASSSSRFLALVVLVGARRSRLALGRRSAPQGELDSVVSRESAFLLNNVLLVAATFTVFFGTVFPLLSEAVRGVKVSVGAPFFNQVNVPLFLSLIFLMGVGPLIAWRRASLDNLKRNFLWPVVIGLRRPAALLRLLGVRLVAGGAHAGAHGLRGGDHRASTSSAPRARAAPWASGRCRRSAGCCCATTGATAASSSTWASSWSRSASPARRRGRCRPRPRSSAASRPSWPATASASTACARARSRTTSRSPAPSRSSNGRAAGTVLQPAKKFYPQEQSPIAYVDYRLGLRRRRLPRARRLRPRRLLGHREAPGQPPGVAGSGSAASSSRSARCWRSCRSGGRPA